MTRLLTLALKLLEKVVPASTRDGLVGDLTELFQERRARWGILAAWAWLTSQVGGTLWRFALRRLRSVFRGVWNVRLEGKMRLTDVAAGWLRQLHRARAYSVLVIAMIAIGVGAVSTVFALVEGVVLRRCPTPTRIKLSPCPKTTLRLPSLPGGPQLPTTSIGERARKLSSPSPCSEAAAFPSGLKAPPPMRMARW